MGKKVDLTGHRFGRLVVLCENGRAKCGFVLWLCRCDCGSEVTVVGNNLRAGHTTSCGCLHRERATECHTTHGMRKTRLYRVWVDMLVRTGVCKGADGHHKRAYKDRGISVCSEWLNFENFRDWALTHGYSDGFEIDRIDNNAGYCPENCRWITHRENCNNRRCTLRLEDGTSLAMFCSEVGIQTCENGNSTKQYARIRYAYIRHHKAHPELVQKANELIALYTKTLKMVKLLEDAKQLRACV